MLGRFPCTCVESEQVWKLTKMLYQCHTTAALQDSDQCIALPHALLAHIHYNFCFLQCSFVHHYTLHSPSAMCKLIAEIRKRGDIRRWVQRVKKPSEETGRRQTYLEDKTMGNSKLILQTVIKHPAVDRLTSFCSYCSCNEGSLTTF